MFFPNVLRLCLVTLCAFSVSYNVAAGKTQWGKWSEYGDCSSTCGNAVKTRIRICEERIKDADEFGREEYEIVLFENDECEKGDIERERLRCRLPPCKVDGRWGQWSSPSECESSNCTSNKGYQYQYRSCTNPEPQHGGAMCEGPLVKYTECQEPTNCPIDGGYTEWSDYVCSIEDDDYIAKRVRNCTNPEPRFGGGNCNKIGLSEDTIFRVDNTKIYDEKICIAFVKENPPKIKEVEVTTMANPIDEEYVEEYVEDYV